MQGKMVRPTDGEAAFKEMYETGVVRAIDWFDQVLPPTAVVIWMAGGASVLLPFRRVTMVLYGARGRPLDLI